MFFPRNQITLGSADAPTAFVEPDAGKILTRARDTRAVAPSREMCVVVVSDTEELSRRVGEWDELAAAALEPNPFYESWMLLPAARAFGQDKELLFVLVYEAPRVESGLPILHGLFPLERRKRYKGLPVKTLGLWQHLHCFLCTPLVRAARARECVAAFFDWLATEGAALMEFNLITGDGPFHQLLLEEFGERRLPFHLDHHFTRALFRPSADAETYLRDTRPGRRRKELRRQERRLAEQGPVEYAELEPDGDVAQWAEEFLSIEASGWKGRGGTAMAERERERAYFLEMTRAAQERGQLMMLGLRVGGRPVAMKCNFLAGAGSFAFKIAFDESFAIYSPGVLLETENIRRLHERAGLEWMDSCSAPSNFINSLWPDRRTICTLVAATGRKPGGLVVSLLPSMRRLNRRLAFLRASSRVQTPKVVEESREDESRTAHARSDARLLEIEPATFRADFNRRPFLIRHALANHPLFEIPRLVELAARLPEGCVRYGASDVPVATQLYGNAHNGLSIAETLTRIEECRSWMVMKFVEHDPEYGALLDACLDEVEPLSEPLAPGMFQRAGFIFVSSPDSVTPYHLDPEYNFLLQARGGKTVYMFDAADRSVLSDEELESYYSASDKYNLSFRDEYQTKAEAFELSPGLGLHFPVTAPHWVRNSGEVSVSFSVTFKTLSSERRGAVYNVNSRLRRLGLRPAPFGQSSLRDSAKSVAFRAVTRASRVTLLGGRGR